MLISFYTTRVTLEQLGVNDFGLNNLLSCVVSMFSFINSSMGTAVQRYYCIEIGRQNAYALKRIFGVGLFLHLIIATITFLVAEIFAFIFLDRMNISTERLNVAHFVFQMGLLTLCMGIITLPYTALLRAREMFSQTAIVEIFQAFFRLLNLYLLIISPFDKLASLAVLNFIVSFITILTFVILARRFEESHTYPIFDKNMIKGMLKFVTFLIFGIFAQLLNAQGITVLINIFFGLTINAAYAVALQVQNAVNTFVVNFKVAVVPQIMSSYGAEDLKSMHLLIDLGTKITFLMMLVISIPIIFCSDYVLKIWLNNPPQHASEFVALILICININSFTYFHYQGVHASGKIAKQQTWISLSYIVSTIIVFILFYEKFSFFAAIYVNMGVALFQNTINIYYAKKIFNYSIKNFFSAILIPSVLIVVFCFGLTKGLLSLVENLHFKFVLLFLIDVCIIPFISLYILFNQNERIKIVLFFKKSWLKHSCRRL